MKPFIKQKRPLRVFGGTQESRGQTWSFERKSIAKAKRDTRRARRREDKQSLNEK